MQITHHYDAEANSLTETLAEKFIEVFEPIECDAFVLFCDERTGAIYAECHILASKLIELGTDDAPLDPDSSSDYRANRNVVNDHAAFSTMKLAASQNRSFSNLVCEFVKGDKRPLHIIGGSIDIMQ